MTEDEEETELGTSSPWVAENPSEKDLIKAYIQYSEEARYRDGLMHNSYYFISIALVIFAGHILSLNLKTTPITSIRFGFGVIAGGAALVGISLVMNTYHRKRVNAQDQRQILENALDRCFTKTGLMKKYGDSDFEPREEDNPFAIQKTVISRDQGWSEKFFKETLTVNTITKLASLIGAATVLCGILIIAIVFGQNVCA